MRLANVAKHFDRVTFADAYNPGTTFLGQFGLFDDTTRDGMTVERRVLSVAPEVAIPSRRTVIADGITWLIGDDQRDYFKGSAIRHKYVVHRATELAAVKSFEQVLANSTGTSMWAARVWVKASKEVESSSDLVNVFDIYVARGEAVADNSMILVDGRWHLVRTTYPSTAGMLAVFADELPEPVVLSVPVTTREYLAVQDEYVETTQTVPAIRIRWQSFFRYPTVGSDKYKPGDDVMLFRKSDITIEAGSQLPILGEPYTALSVTDTGSLWSVHLRHD